MKQKSPQRVFSVNVPDAELADYLNMRKSTHHNGLSGYIRDLIKADRTKWLQMEKTRMQALAKLTDDERIALGLSL